MNGTEFANVQGEPFPAPGPDMDTPQRRALWDRLRVWQIMSRVVMVVPADAPMARAARMLLRYKVGGLPVMADGRLVGIITETDFLRAFVALQKPPRRAAPKRR